MRRRLDIASSIVVTPRLLFLDEPTTGLDPRSRNQVWEIVRVLVAEGTTVLLTTQYLEEADQLADRIAIIDHGRLIEEGTPAELKARVGTGGTLHIRVVDPAQRDRAAQVVGTALHEQVRTGADPVLLTASAPSGESAARAIVALSDAGVEIAELSLGQPSLDEVFLALTGRPTPSPEEDAA